MGSGPLQDVLGLFHLYEEGRLAFQDAIRGTNPRKDTINWRQDTLQSRHVATKLGKDHSDTRLPQQGGLAAHIRSRY